MTKVSLQCRNCTGEFLVSPSHVKTARFCSPTCRTLAKTTLNSCQQCGNEFRVKPYRKESARFCSLPCKHKSMDQGLTTELDRIRRSAEYRLWRTAVFERDNYTCQECGRRGGYLEADHIKPFAHHPQLRFELSNGRTLCQPCHRKTPTFGGRSRVIAFSKGY